MTQTEGTRDRRERRRSARYGASLSASITIAASEATIPFEITDSVISNISEGGTSLSLNVVTTASKLDLSKLLAAGRPFRLSCKFPGSDRTSHLSGAIAWSTSEETPDGFVVRLGIDLDESTLEGLVDLRWFVADVEEEKVL